MIDAGQLIHRFAIHKFDGSRDSDYGDELRNDENHFILCGRRWGKYEPEEATTEIAGKQMQGTIKGKVVMRFFRGLNPIQYKLMFRGRLLHILGVKDLEERGELQEIMVSEGAQVYTNVEERTSGGMTAGG